MNIYVRTCPVCDDGFETTERRQKYCSEVCAKMAGDILADDEERETNYKPDDFEVRLTFNGKYYDTWHRGGIGPELREAVLQRDGYKCHVCGRGHNLHIHHIIPRVDGGKHTMANLITLCSGCHRSIEALSADEAINHCVKRAIREVEIKFSLV